MQGHVDKFACICYRSFRIHLLKVEYHSARIDHETHLNFVIWNSPRFFLRVPFMSSILDCCNFFFLPGNEVSLNLCQLSMHSYGQTRMSPKLYLFSDLLARSFSNSFSYFLLKSIPLNTNKTSLTVTYTRSELQFCIYLFGVLAQDHQLDLVVSPI